MYEEHERWAEPSEQNRYLAEHVALLARSFRHWTGHSLFPYDLDGEALGYAIWDSLYVIVSQTAEREPRFNYGNYAALDLFAMTWDAFTALPSRKSSPPGEQRKRDKLMEAVARDGFVTGYRGIRQANDGFRFWIEDAVVWNVVDDQGVYRGQAARFLHWTMIP